MAALHRCSPGLVVGAGQLSIGSSSRVRMTPQHGRHAIGAQTRSTTLLLKTSAGRMTAAASHVRHRHAIRPRSGGNDYWSSLPDPGDSDKPMTEEEFNEFRKELKKLCDQFEKDIPFQEDILKIDEYYKQMTSWNTSIFHMKATALSLHLCMIVRSGVKLASGIMNSAAISLDKQYQISFHTTKQTLMVYVSTFVKLADDAYHKKFNDQSVFSLLGAFRGVAAISHILLQDAMASINYADDNLSNCKLVRDIEDSQREFEQKIRNLEHNFRAALRDNRKAYELLRPTMEDIHLLSTLFVMKMLAKREMVLGHVRGASPSCDRPSDDGEPGAAETGSDSAY